VRLTLWICIEYKEKAGGLAFSHSMKAPLLSDAAATIAGAVPALRSNEDGRMAKYIDAMAEGGEALHPKLGACIRAFQPFVGCLLTCLYYVAPLYWKLMLFCFRLYNILPINVLQMIFGLGLCFFGGTYVTSIAAIEAFRTLGGKSLWKNLQIVYADMQKVSVAIKDDMEVDADGDDIPDVEQMPAKDMARREMKLAMVTVQDPEVLQKALLAVWTSWIAVLASLRLQFAQTVALALGIADVLKFPTVLVFAPPLTLALGKDLKHWVDTIIDTTLKIVAVTFAWYIQMVISSFYSALRGGKMFAEALFRLLEEKDLLEKLPAALVPKPFDPDKTYLDEMIMYPLAAAGFWFQLKSGFLLPFPLNLIMLPLTIVEWVLRWEITYGAAAPM
jgi:hypothetical protein